MGCANLAPICLALPINIGVKCHAVSVAVNMAVLAHVFTVLLLYYIVYLALFFLCNEYA